MARAGLTLKRREAGTGSLLAAVVAVAALFTGISGNWVAALGEPPAAVVWTVFAVAAAATAVLAMIAFHAGRDESPDGPVPVTLAGQVDSVDTGCDVWPLAEFTPERATVHTAVGRRTATERRVAGVDAEPVPYVERDHDAALGDDLAAAARGEHHGLILLRGGSSTGKTRSLFEAIHATCAPLAPPRRHRPGRAEIGWQVVRPAGREALRALPGAGLLDRAPTVLWLNELQGFLGANGTGLTRRLLTELHHAADGHPLVVVGTVWPVKLTQATDPNLESTRDVRELLSQPNEYLRAIHDVPDRLTSGETVRARRSAEEAADPRIERALDERSGFGFTQTLAGAGELLEFYRAAPPAVRLVLEAAADYRRLGGQAAIPTDLLRRLARELWYEAYAPQIAEPGILAAAVNTAGQRLRDDDGGVRALIPVARGWTLADYLEEHLTSTRRGRIVSDSVWDGLVTCEVPDLLVFAQAAQDRGRVEVEERLLRRSLDLGIPGTGRRLAYWLKNRDRQYEAEPILRAAVAAGDRNAHSDLGRWLEIWGNDDYEARSVWRAAVAAGDEKAHSELAFRIGSWGGRRRDRRTALARRSERPRTRRLRGLRRMAPGAGPRRRGRTGPARRHRDW